MLFRVYTFFLRIILFPFCMMFIAQSAISHQNQFHTTITFTGQIVASNCVFDKTPDIAFDQITTEKVFNRKAKKDFSLSLEQCPNAEVTLVFNDLNNEMGMVSITKDDGRLISDSNIKLQLYYKPTTGESLPIAFGDPKIYQLSRSSPQLQFEAILLPHDKKKNIITGSINKTVSVQITNQ